MDLAQLGIRICILGPSNSGKSTLADAIGRQCGLEVVHLNRLYFVPRSNWAPRPPGEFRALHDAAIENGAWIMYGNYAACRPQRIARATGVILMDTPVVPNLLRYVRRTLLETNRTGTVEGAAERIGLSMIQHILIGQPRRQHSLRKTVRQDPIPRLRITSMRSLNQRYARWGLE